MNMNNNIFNGDEINNSRNENSKKIKLLYDEKPEIVSYGKSAATDIGDFICSFIEHLLTRYARMSNQIRECSIQHTSPLIPDLTDQQTSNSLYERDIIPINFPSSSDYEDLESNILSLLQHRDPKFTDDTFFDKNAYKSCLEHDKNYQLSQDRNKYNFVSGNKNFANTNTTKNNLEHAYTFNLATSYNNAVYTKEEFGGGAQGALNMISKCASDKRSKEFNFSQVMSKYKEEEKKSNKFGGRSYGNGAVMQNGVNIFAAQGFEQGLKLTDILINNLYDNDHSRRAARALFTTGFCANCGLRQETILNIVHFLYYDPNPLKNGEEYTNPENYVLTENPKRFWSYDGQFLRVGKYNFCTLDMISHRGNKTLDNAQQDKLQKIDEEDCNGYVENNYFATNALPTAMLVLKICLTSKCAEEAIRKILRAAGDSDTIAAAAMPIIAALFGLPKDWVEKIWAHSMQNNKMTKEEQTPENTKKDGEPDDLRNIKKFDQQGNFIYHNEINRLADKTYGHHYRENAKIEWQLKNIRELMKYLVTEKENSIARNEDDLLKYIFKRIRADIDFMLDKNKEYELEKEPDLNITVKEIEEAKKLTKEQTSIDGKARALRLKYLKAKNKVRIYKHRNATAEFQTKAKNDKLNNLTQKNVKNIKTELTRINKLFSQAKDDANKIEAIEADKYEALSENNGKINLLMQEDIKNTKTELTENNNCFNDVRKNDFYDDKIYDDMYEKARKELEIRKERDAKYIKIKTAKSGENTTTETKATSDENTTTETKNTGDTNTKIIFWTRKKKSLAGITALIIVAGNVVLFWQLSFAVASLSALGTWTLYFFVLWLINHLNGSEPGGKMSTTEPEDNKKQITNPTKEKIKQPLINNQIIEK